MERNDASEKEKPVTAQCENQEKETSYVASPIYVINMVTFFYMKFYFITIADQRRLSEPTLISYQSQLLFSSDSG